MTSEFGFESIPEATNRKHLIAIKGISEAKRVDSKVREILYDLIRTKNISYDIHSHIEDSVRDGLYVFGSWSVCDPAVTSSNDSKIEIELIWNYNAECLSFIVWVAYLMIDNKTKTNLQKVLQEQTNLPIMQCLFR